MQRSYLARGGRELNDNFEIMSDPELRFGLAFDQHHLERNRQYDMFELRNSRPELLGVGLDENTAIIVQGNEFEVIGVFLKKRIQ